MRRRKYIGLYGRRRGSSRARIRRNRRILRFR